MTPSILIIEDEAALATTLKDRLKKEGYAVTVARDGLQGLEKATHEPFDLILLDISLSDKHGIDVLKQLKSEQPDVKIIVLSMYPEEQYGVRALKAGAMGYINKQSAPEKLVGAIQQVISGKKYISAPLAEQLLSNLIGESQELMHQNLSNREYQTLCLMASGKSLTEISEIMALSPKTVSVYRARMLEKMGFKNNAEAVHYAIAHNLVEAKK